MVLPERTEGERGGGGGKGGMGGQGGGNCVSDVREGTGLLASPLDSESLFRDSARLASSLQKSALSSLGNPWSVTISPTPSP